MSDVKTKTNERPGLQESSNVLAKNRISKQNCSAAVLSVRPRLCELNRKKVEKEVYENEF